MAYILGENGVGGESLELHEGWPFAAKFVASSSGKVTSLSFHAGSTVPSSGGYEVGVYYDKSGIPGNLAVASVAVGSPPLVNAWNEVSISLNVVGGETYWLAILPLGSGTFDISAKSGPEHEFIYEFFGANKLTKLQNPFGEQNLSYFAKTPSIYLGGTLAPKFTASIAASATDAASLVTHRQIKASVSGSSSLKAQFAPRIRATVVASGGLKALLSTRAVFSASVSSSATVGAKLHSHKLFTASIAGISALKVSNALHVYPKIKASFSGKSAAVGLLKSPPPLSPTILDLVKEERSIREGFRNWHWAFYDAKNESFRSALPKEKHIDIRTFASEAKEEWTGGEATSGPQPEFANYPGLHIPLKEGTTTVQSITLKQPLDLESHFTDEDLIVMALPNFPLASVKTTESFIDFTSSASGSFSENTASVKFSESTKALSEGNCEFRIPRSVITKQINVKSITGIRFRINGTKSTGRVLVAGLRLIGSEWVLPSVDFDNWNGRLVKPVPLDGNISDEAALKFETLWHADNPAGSSDPKPVNVEMGTIFYTGSKRVANLIDNPNIEHGLGGISNTGGHFSGGAATLEQVTTTPYQGAHCLKIVSTASSQGARWAIGGGSWAANKTYTALVALRGSVGGEKCEVFLASNAGNGTVTNATLTTSWQIFQTSFSTTAEGVEPTLYVRVNQASTIYADAVVVTEGTSTPIYADGDMKSAGYEWSGVEGESTTLVGFTVANPILNPGFEGDAVGAAPGGEWIEVVSPEVTPEVFAVSETWAASGKKSLHIKAKHPANTNLLLVEARTGFIPVTPGTVWTAQAVLNLISATAECNIVWYWYKADKTTLISSAGGALLFAGETGVHTITQVTNAAPAEAAYLRIGIRNFNSTSNGTFEFYVDNIIAAEGEHASLTYVDGDTPGYYWSGTPGNSSTTTEGNVVKIFMREHTNTAVTQSTLNSKIQSQLDSEGHQPSSSGSPTWIEFLLKWGYIKELQIIDSSEKGYKFENFATLQENTHYVFIASLEETEARIRIFKLENDLAFEGTKPVYDTTIINDDFIFVRNKGRVGWQAALERNDAYLGFMRPRSVTYAEYRSKPIKSFTPVEGAQLYVEYGPDIQKWETFIEAPSDVSTGSAIERDTARSTTGESWRVKIFGNTTEQGIQSNLFLIDNLESFLISFDIWYPEALITKAKELGQKTGLKAQLVSLSNAKVELTMPKISYDQWYKAKLELPGELLLNPDFYALSLLQPSEAQGEWWIDNVKIIEPAMNWSARSMLPDAWGVGYAPWTDFGETINDSKSGVLFPVRAKELQIRGQALVQTAKVISPPKIIPKYAELGKLVWPENAWKGLTPPTANFEWTVTIQGGKATIKFTSTSTPGSGPIVLYEWDFGDGTRAVGYPKTSHKYEDSGEYIVTLTVVDGYGQRSSFAAKV